MDNATDIQTASAPPGSVQRMVRRMDKSQGFFDRIAAKRALPGNCVRCGRENSQPKYKTCPRCLDAVRRRKIAAAEKPVVERHALVRRIESLELAVANLQLSHSKIYERAYNSGRRVGARPARRYFDAYPKITKQELARINHAYERESA